VDAGRRPSRPPLPPDPQVHLGAHEKGRLTIDSTRRKLGRLHDYCTATAVGFESTNPGLRQVRFTPVRLRDSSDRPCAIARGFRILSMTMERPAKQMHLRSNSRANRTSTEQMSGQSEVTIYSLGFIGGGLTAGKFTMQTAAG
jgi:hypothetical protein